MRNSMVEAGSANAGMPAYREQMIQPAMANPNSAGGLSRPRFRQIDGSAVTAANRLAAGASIEVRWGGTPHLATLTLTGVPVLPADGTYFALEWEDQSGVLGLSRADGEALLASRCGVVDWEGLPPELACALVQDGLDEIGARLAEHGLGALRVRSLTPPVRAGKWPYPLELRVRGNAGEEVWRALLRVDRTGLRKIAALLPPQVVRPSALARWQMLRLPVTIELGWVDLPLSLLKRLRNQDVLLPDGWWPADDRTAVCLRITPALGVAAKRDQEGRLLAMSTVKPMAQEPEQADGHGPAAAGVAALAEVPVRITFDLGGRALPLSEIAMVAPGHVFDLGLSPERAVNLRINGARVGEGMLVEVDGRIGVAVTRFAPPGEI